MNLLIVESPAKAKTITKYLDNKYTIRASVGHIRDLPKSNKNAIDIDGGFIPHYEILPGKENVIAELKKLTARASNIIIATDPDREGEAIAWHVAEVCDIKKPRRAVFNEITAEAVRAAVNHPRSIDTNLRRAQEARRVLDRLVGYDLSNLIWKKVRYGLSAGRVQSPALRIIMEREREIRAFRPQDYWIISADFNLPKKEKLNLVCSREITQEKEAQTIVKIAKKENWQIVDVNKTQTKRSPRPPFITSTLQQTASSRLGFSPNNTMRLAQRLYEDGHITYLRTDSTNLSELALNQMAVFIKKEYGDKYLSPRRFTTKSKTAQEAHEAIRPTKISKISAGGSKDEQKLYQLIWARATASQMADAILNKTKVIANVASKSIPDFYRIGSELAFDGWFKVDPFARGEDTELPTVTIGQQLQLANIICEQKQTEPPNRYSEAGLIKELEKRGIGRPSTYAAIIKTLKERQYVVLENKALNPTDTGEVVNDFLEKNFNQIISDSFTAEMEDKLDEIADGKRDYTTTLSKFYIPFSRDVRAKEKTSTKITELGKADAKIKCPLCKSEMVIKLGKNGKFLSCARFPKCDGARTIDGKELAGPKETGEACPKCQDGKLVEREGKFGKFISCSNYPKCKYIKEDPAEAERKKTGVICPECNRGEIVERRGRFGIFYACNNYPRCKFAIKSRPTGKKCSLCHSLMMTGTKTIPDRCSNKNCPNHNPHKKN